MHWLPSIALIALVALSACGATSDVAATTTGAPARATPAGGAPAPAAASDALTPMPPADITLDPNQVDPVTVKVGQVINIPDDPGFEWIVSYRPEVLVALTPPERIGKPGPVGWFFRAVGPGSTEIVLESVPPPCRGGTPCPPNVVRRVFSIQSIP